MTWGSALLGALLGASNVIVLGRLVGLFISGARDGRAPSIKKIVILLGLKFTLLAAIIVLIVQKGYVRPLAFLAGLTVGLGGSLACMSLRGSVSSPTR